MTPNPQDSAVALEVERAAFEAWAGSLDSWLPNIKRSGDHYVSAVTAAAWHAWQKRASQSDGTSGGWQSVPSKPTTEMIAAGMKRMFDEKRYSAPWDDVVDLMYRAMLAAAPNQYQGENHVG